MKTLILSLLTVLLFIGCSKHKYPENTCYSFSSGEMYLKVVKYHGENVDIILVDGNEKNYKTTYIKDFEELFESWSKYIKFVKTDCDKLEK